MIDDARSTTGEGRLGREIPTQSGYGTWGMQTWPLELEVTPQGRIVQLGASGWYVVLIEVLDGTYRIPGPLLHSILKDICMFGVRLPTFRSNW
jgi:hypothetical protein